MLVNNKEKIESIWRQKNIPVIYRRGTGHPLLLRLPYKEDNYSWLRDEKRYKPKWITDKKYWEVPQAWYNDLVENCLTRWGSVYIIQPFREQEKCAPACWNAKGHECQCSCMGKNHGSGDSDSRWFIVSDTFATKWNTKELACRLLVAK